MAVCFTPHCVVIVSNTSCTFTLYLAVWLTIIDLLETNPVSALSSSLSSTKPDGLSHVGVLVSIHLITEVVPLELVYICRPLF